VRLLSIKLCSSRLSSDCEYVAGVAAMRRAHECAQAFAASVISMQACIRRALAIRAAGALRIEKLRREADAQEAAAAQLAERKEKLHRRWRVLGHAALLAAALRLAAMKCAALRIQRLWRGFAVRKYADERILACRQRLEMARAHNLQLFDDCKRAISVLKRKSVGFHDVMLSCEQLLSGVQSSAAIRATVASSGVVPMLIKLLGQLSCTDPHVALLKVTVGILFAVAKENSAWANAVFQNGITLALLIDKLQTHRMDVALCTRLCPLISLFLDDRGKVHTVQTRFPDMLTRVRMLVRLLLEYHMLMRLFDKSLPADASHARYESK
jgi:hypothetical protein